MFFQCFENPHKIISSPDLVSVLCPAPYIMLNFFPLALAGCLKNKRFGIQKCTKTVAAVEIKKSEEERWCQKECTSCDLQSYPFQFSLHPHYVFARASMKTLPRHCCSSPHEVLVGSSLCLLHLIPRVSVMKCTSQGQPHPQTHSLLWVTSRNLMPILTQPKLPTDSQKTWLQSMSLPSLITLAKHPQKTYWVSFWI